MTASPARPIVAITHAEQELDRFFLPGDLDRLRGVAEIRVLGGNQRPVVLPQLADVDILLGSWGMPRADAELLAAAPRLRAICYAAGSVKYFVTPESYARQVLVTTAMHANAIPVAEATLALIILANKNWFHAQNHMRAERAHVKPTMAGNFQSSVGIIGYGAIARLVVEKLLAMDVRILVYDPLPKSLPAGVEAVDLLTLARQSDVVSLHAPDIPATHGMCGAEFFAAMRDGATFINTARGRLVDETVLIDHLQRGRISAHLDVTFPEPPVADSPFYTLPNVWLTPHIAGSSGPEIRRMGRLAIEECLAVIAGRAPRYPVTEAMLPTMA